MKNYTFLKEVPETVKDGIQNEFNKLPPILSVDVSRYETPLQSIRRTMGDEFYNLYGCDIIGKENDVLNIFIEDNGIFNLSENFDPSLKTKLIDFINNVIETFVIANEGETKFTAEQLNDKSKVRLSLTREEDGLSQDAVCLNDFKDIIEFKDDELVGIIKQKELVSLSNELERLNIEYNKLASVDSNKASIISENASKCLDKLIKVSDEVASKFFNIICNIMYEDPEAIKNVFDIQIYTSFSNGSDKNFGVLHDYHDISVSEVNKLKEFFNL